MRECVTPCPKQPCIYLAACCRRSCPLPGHPISCPPSALCLLRFSLESFICCPWILRVALSAARGGRRRHTARTNCTVSIVSKSHPRGSAAVRFDASVCRRALPWGCVAAQREVRGRHPTRGEAGGARKKTRLHTIGAPCRGADSHVNRFCCRAVSLNFVATAVLLLDRRGVPAKAPGAPGLEHSGGPFTRCARVLGPADEV